jgi:DNA mismatch endonuclease, patch repair protein
VEVRGCFWHACPLHQSYPRANREWWSAKFARTQERDLETERIWRAAGWDVVIVWEHEDPEAVAQQLAALLERKREQSATTSGATRRTLG